MSKESLPQPSQSEEIDLGQLFNAIGQLFERFYKFILSIFKFIFSIFIATSGAIIKNFKIIIGAMIIAAIAGYALEKTKTTRYDSSMLVRTYYDAKYQLHTNLNYYNALLDDENYIVLNDIFNLDEETLKQIISFEIDRGPESDNEKMQEYDRYLKSLDSVRAQAINFDDYLDSRDVFAGNLFEIKVESTSKNIFLSLEEGMHKAFVNDYSNKKKKKRDSMLYIRKQTILNSIAELDSLQSVYINVLEEESKSTRARISLGDGFPLQQEKSTTNEYQLINKEIQLRGELRDLEEKSVEEDQFFDVISSFQLIGNRVSEIREKYSILFPAIAFLLLCLGYLGKNYVRFVKNYDR